MNIFDSLNAIAADQGDELQARAHALEYCRKKIDELTLASNIWEARYCIELAKRAISENAHGEGARLAASILRDLWVTEQAEVRSLCFLLEKGNATKDDVMGVIDIMNTWMFQATCEHKRAYGTDANFIVCERCKKHLDEWPKEGANNG